LSSPAQKRGEKLQNVPIAITALTANQLVRANIQSVSDLTLATPPSLNFSQTAVFAQPYIRGVGTDSFSPGNEASVATYVDGVYIASMNAGTFALNNIARIEVLKGPQGTLYGRNSTRWPHQCHHRDAGRRAAYAR
jgi:iron complex outermembrane receptor protein